jgi:hypothetical protein
MSLELDPETRSAIANLPDDGTELDNNYVVGILLRYDMARKLLPTLFAGQERMSVSQAALYKLVENDIPALLRTVAAFS